VDLEPKPRRLVNKVSIEASFRRNWRWSAKW